MCKYDFETNFFQKKKKKIAGKGAKNVFAFFSSDFKHIFSMKKKAIILITVPHFLT